MFARFRKWRPLIAVVQALGTWTAVAVNFIVHWGLLIAVLGTVLAVAGQIFSPHFTDPVIAGLLAFAAIRVLIWQLRVQTLPNLQGPTGQQPHQSIDYEEWDKIDPLKLVQVAALWKELDPTPHGGFAHPESHLILLRLKQAIINQQLSIVGRMLHPTVYIDQMPEGIPDATMLRRADLITYANSTKERPKFLFPSERK